MTALAWSLVGTTLALALLTIRALRRDEPARFANETHLPMEGEE